MQNKLNILNISSPDITYASGIVPFDLHKEFLKKNNSVLLVRTTKTKEKNVFSYYSEISIARAINKILWLFNKRLKTDPNYYFFDPYPNRNLINIKRVLSVMRNPDVIIAYFVGGFFTMQDLYALQKKTKAPILLYLMDMAYLTGGCHYSWDCDGYKSDCSNCPAFLKNADKQIAKINLAKFNHLINDMNITAIVGSEQLYKQTKESTLFRNRQVEKILIGIDSNVFFKKRKMDVRLKYNILQDKFVILFSAVFQNEKRKGLEYLISALKLFREEVDISQIVLLSIGKENEYFRRALTEYHIVEIGFLTDMNILSDMYNVANVVVVPSIQDSGPMVINQAITCGTPVVCFNIGVSSDLVFNGVTGYIAEAHDFKMLFNGILQIYKLTEKEYEIVSENCVKAANEKLNIFKQSELFLKIAETQKSKKFK